MPDSKMKELLEQDMRDIGLNQRELGEKLNRSQQAISAWFARDKVPSSQIANLRKVLGDNSKLIRYLAEHQGLNGFDDQVREFSPDTPQSVKARITNEEVFRKIVSEELGEQGLQGTIEINGHRVRVDYMSTTLACEVMNLDSMVRTIPIGIQLWQRGSRRVLDLAVIKKARPKMRCVMALVAPEIEFDAPVNRLTMYCTTLGIDVWVSGCMEEVADKIVTHETELVKSIPFLDISE
ncbi:MAG: hypothetical protein C0422_09800 [Alcaligenaceae bacterium]|nr:hypothetical protein [Alcaligenaceae bacterium]